MKKLKRQDALLQLFVDNGGEDNTESIYSKIRKYWKLKGVETKKEKGSIHPIFFHTIRSTFQPLRKKGFLKNVKGVNVKSGTWKITAHGIDYINKSNPASDEDTNTKQKNIQKAKKLNNKELRNANQRPPKPIYIEGRNSYKINSRLAKTVLVKTDFKCEANTNHKTFSTKKMSNYVECHHLIPMSFQKRKFFLNKRLNLDREENITSLCPTCHRAVHLGIREEQKEILKKLYDKKGEKLKELKLVNSLSELISYYR
jgi:hypothetical protein